MGRRRKSTGWPKGGQEVKDHDPGQAICSLLRVCLCTCACVCSVWCAQHVCSAIALQGPVNTTNSNPFPSPSSARAMQGGDLPGLFSPRGLGLEGKSYIRKERVTSKLIPNPPKLNSFKETGRQTPETRDRGLLRSCQRIFQRSWEYGR